jgi:beta-N-acetylhexosaminidase
MTSAPTLRRRALAAAAASLLALPAACSESGSKGATPTSSSTAARTSQPTPTAASSSTPAAQTSTPAPATTTATCAERIAARLTPAQQAGQLLMVGLHASESSRALAAQVSRQQLGGVVYLGGWHQGSAQVTTVSQRLQAAARARAGATGGVGGLLVAADQEGGEVQQLRGSGFTRMPSARTQATLGTASLQRAAAAWARELKRAGVNVNLAPVADTVPTSLGSRNAPIGAHRRDFVPGSASANGRYAAAFVRGTRAAGVAPTVKHFPGLGRVSSNTDFAASGITDGTTTATDPYLEPFREAIAAGAPLVMLSSARYTRIDGAHQAMFSSTVISSLLRGRLGFDGVVISDDVGAARSVSAVPVGERATRFVAAGGDIVLTAESGQAGTMIAALTARARTSPAFAAQLRAATARVVALKVRLGLASCG